MLRQLLCTSVFVVLIVVFILIASIALTADMVDSPDTLGGCIRRLEIQSAATDVKVEGIQKRLDSIDERLVMIANSVIKNHVDMVEVKTKVAFFGLLGGAGGTSAAFGGKFLFGKRNGNGKSSGSG